MVVYTIDGFAAVVTSRKNDNGDMKQCLRQPLVSRITMFTGDEAIRYHSPVPVVYTRTRVSSVCMARMSASVHHISCAFLSVSTCIMIAGYCVAGLYLMRHVLQPVVVRNPLERDFRGFLPLPGS